MTLTLIQPVSNWTHWATLRRHPCLSRAATSASSQVNPIFRRSLLTTPLQFALGRPGPFLYPGTCQYSLLWYALVVHTEDLSEPAKSSFSQYVVHGVLSSSGSDLHVHEFCILRLALPYGAYLLLFSSVSSCLLNQTAFKYSVTSLCSLS